VKRPSYLAQLATGVTGQAALRPPPLLFRPPAPDGGDFAATVNESRPARSAVAEKAANLAGEQRTSLGDRAPRSRGLEGWSNAPVAAARHEIPVSLSPARAAAESHPSVPMSPVHDRTAQLRPTAAPAAVSSADPPANRSASRTPLPPDAANTLGDSRQRESLKATALMPRPPNYRAPSSVAGDRKHSNSRDSVSVRIGTLEVRIDPPPTPTPQRPALAPRAPSPSRKGSLARGFGSFGMVQG
jgi:hypothetical protein